MKQYEMLVDTIDHTSKIKDTDVGHSNRLSESLQYVQGDIAFMLDRCEEGNKDHLRSADNFIRIALEHLKMVSDFIPKEEEAKVLAVLPVYCITHKGYSYTVEVSVDGIFRIYDFERDPLYASDDSYQAVLKAAEAEHKKRYP